VQLPTLPLLMGALLATDLNSHPWFRRHPLGVNKLANYMRELSITQLVEVTDPGSDALLNTNTGARMFLYLFLNLKNIS